MKISIICPLYNAENYIEDLYLSIKKQKGVCIAEIKFILTESSDNTEEKLKKLKCNYKKISKQEFSHSLVREKAAFEAEGEIIVFITQDIKIVDEYWLYYLTKDIIEPMGIFVTPAGGFFVFGCLIALVNKLTNYSISKKKAGCSACPGKDACHGSEGGC